MKWVMVGAAFTFVLFAIWFEMHPSTYDEKKVVIVDDITEEVLGEFVVEIADTRIKQTKGLGGRDRLADDRGMLFVYDEPRPQTFWMKDMLIPIDIIWLLEGEIVGIEHEVRPPVAAEELARYYSPESVDVVFEIASGRSVQLGLEVGDRLFVR